MADAIYKQRFGDRREGRLIRSLPARTKFTPFIMKTHSDASNLYKDKIEIAYIVQWLREKREEGYTDLGMLHIFIAAYIRVISQRPALNRFVSGQRIFSRHDIEIVMLVKHSLNEYAEESAVKVKFVSTDTVFDVYRKVNAAIDEAKASEGGNGAEKFAKSVGKLPRLLINFTMGLIKISDYFGIMPQSLHDISPFHGSLCISDLGSLGIPPIIHHFNNFGNVPMFLAFGTNRKELQLDNEGRIIAKDYINFTLTCDERICDNFYMAESIKYLKYCLHNPQLLEAPPEKVEQDIF